MLSILHLSAECYPVAKAGGLADVVGSLPKYLRDQDVRADVIMPKYNKEWIDGHRFEKVYEAEGYLGSDPFHFIIEREFENSLGFSLFVVDIPERFDRPGIYIDPFTGSGYWDELERFLSFQVAVLDWLKQRTLKPDIIHCHDHHTALVPFMLTKCYDYHGMEGIPTVLTVHNAEYQGIYDRSNVYLLPSFDQREIGLLDWDGKLNSLASGIKCSWRITTVSPSYMRELSEGDGKLSPLYRLERAKSQGILNGIDTEEWDPKTDSFLHENYSLRNYKQGRGANKKALCEEFDLNPEYPTISFIGRLAREKGADLLPELFTYFIEQEDPVNFLVLGTGDPVLHERFYQMSQKFLGFFDATLDYNEPLAHQIYAGSDFIIMPSRVEPCGLNQMYAMRYGTVPIVRKIGGLKDTVKDIGEDGGYGITFLDFSLEAAKEAIYRSLDLYRDKKKFSAVRRKIMKLDFSWNVSANKYINLYNELINE